MTRDGVRVRLSCLLARLLVQVAAFLVPGEERVEWRAEWNAELWHMCQEGLHTHGQKLHRVPCLRYALGALPDAWCLRGEFGEPATAPALPASRCLGWLAMAALAGVLAVCSSSSIRSEFRQTGWHTPENLSILFLPNGADESGATVKPERFRIWAQHARFLDAIDYYQILPQEVSVSGRSVRLRIAHATQGLRAVVNGEPMPDAAGLHGPELVVTTRAWKRSFRGDPSRTGMVARVNGRAIAIATVNDNQDTGLPGEYDAWLFDDAPMRDGVPGFVIGRMDAEMSTDWYFGYGHVGFRESPTLEVTALSFPVEQRKVNPWWTLALALGLSLLALPATTPLGFGEHVRSNAPSPLRYTVRRLLFMLCKCTLWAVIASSFALLAASVFRASDWRLAVEARLLLSFLVALLGFRWCICDQRRRCPVCLNRLTHPASVGEASKNFLSWNGTELVCESGHGLMHVPAHATSWFQTQRWLSLDPSWHFLFAEKR